MTGQRMSQVDNLRTLMVAWVIGAHALMGYTAVGGWAYDEVNETTFTAGSELALTVLIGPSGLFVIGAFFFVSGLFTPRSVERKGRRAFALDRLVRLGLPWAVSALVVWPLSVWLAYRAAGHDVTPWALVGQRSPFLDSGALWFALVLLIYSIGYALWPGVPGGPNLVLAATAIAAGSFVTRLAFGVTEVASGVDQFLGGWHWQAALTAAAEGVLVVFGSVWLLGLAQRHFTWNGPLATTALRR
jgi:fucose 4-O-acetylase-like acetyltransferase